MSNIRYLSVDDALVLCRVLGDLKVKDLGLLDSALYRPQSIFDGIEPYPTIAQKAAALLHGIVSNHALLDGNKRLAWMACHVFLLRNGYDLNIPIDEGYELVLATARGELDAYEIALVIEANI